MVPSQVLRTLLYGSWEQWTVSLWRLSSLKEDHLGSQPIETVSRIVPDQRWEVIREKDKHVRVIQGAAAKLALIRGLPHSTLGLCKHIAQPYFGVLYSFPQSCIKYESFGILHKKFVSRCIFMGLLQIGNTHLFLYLSGFTLEEMGKRVTALSWNMSHAMKTVVRMISCGWQAGSGSNLEEPDCKQLWRFLAKAPPTSLHSRLGVCVC